MNSDRSPLSNLLTPMDSIPAFSKYGDPIDRLHQGICRLPIERFLVATAAAVSSPDRLRCGYPNVCRKGLFAPLYIQIE